MRRPTKCERLTAQITALGFSDVRLRPMTGAWRTNHRLDVNRWEGSGLTAGFLDQPSGIRVSFSSWDTMTDCLRYGFDTEPGRSWWQIDVYARTPVKNKNTDPADPEYRDTTPAQRGAQDIARAAFTARFTRNEKE